MSMVAKILIVLNLILAVAVMGAAGAYLQSAENYKKMYLAQKEQAENDEKAANEKIANLQTQRDDANRGKAAALQAQQGAEATAETMRTNNALLEKKLNDYNASNQSLAAKLSDLEKGVGEARGQNEKLVAEKNQADTDRRTAIDAKNAAETEQKRLQASLDAATASLDDKTKESVALAERLEQANTHLVMYRDKFGTIGAVQKPVDAMVLAADTASDIYLISVGSGNVNVGDVLTVSRGDQFVAQVVVDRVFTDKSSVVVQRIGGKPMKKADIRQGDKVGTVF
jgi:hypothetical protein